MPIPCQINPPYSSLMISSPGKLTSNFLYNTSESFFLASMCLKSIQPTSHGKRKPTIYLQEPSYCSFPRINDFCHHIFLCEIMNGIIPGMHSMQQVGDIVQERQDLRG